MENVHENLKAYIEDIECRVGDEGIPKGVILNTWIKNIRKAYV
jgi:hypothetical protein